MVEEINLYSFVIDSEKEIKGQIIFISEEVIHVEYKKFKGDKDPFVIEYLKHENPLKAIKKLEKAHPQLLTVGKLKKDLNRCFLDDNAVVMVEHDNSKNSAEAIPLGIEQLCCEDGEWFQFEPGFKTLFKLSFSSSSTKNGRFLIHINY